MKYFLVSLLSVVMLSLFGPVFAQGEATALFLMINPGARQGGVGEAGVATAKDATAIYWNPAGLAFQYNPGNPSSRGEASIMHVNWLPKFNLSDLYYDFLATRYYLDGIGTVGFGIQFMNYGENNQTDTQGNEIGKFTSNEMAVTGSYAVKLQEGLGLGVNLKFIYSRLSPVKVDNERGKGVGAGFALDLGVLYHPGFMKKLSLGVNLSNLGPKLSYIDQAQADPIPTNLRLGLAYRLVQSEFNRLTLVYDINRLMVPRSEDKRDASFLAYLFNSWGDGDLIQRLTHSVGMEYWYSNLIALRAGYFYEHPDYGGRQFYTFGGGVQIAFLGVDFSYILGSVDDSPLADTIRFSLLANF